MPRPAKPARLILRRANAAGGYRTDTWIIAHRGREISTGSGAEDRAGAEQALQAYLAAQYEPPSRERHLARLRISDVMTAYLTEHAPSTASPDWLGFMALPIIEWWASKTLADVRAPTCREYVAHRCGQDVSDQTARHELKTMRAAIIYWHRNHGPLEAVPVVTLPPLAETRRDALTRDEFDQLLNAATEEHIRRLILICRWQGCRPGIALTARWFASVDAPYFDLERGRLYQRGEAERMSRKVKPIQAIHEALMPHLLEWRAVDQNTIKNVVHWGGKPVGKIKRAWATTRRRAGLDDWVTPHVLRHTAISWAIEDGMPLSTAANYFGVSVEMLERVYWHKSPDFQREAARV